jgi:hypothetical protein
MSGERIDVLAVMDDVEDRLCRLGDSPDGSYVTKLREARAAVAELIETSARTVSAFEALGDANGIVHTRVAQRKCEAALVAQKEALARVQGGA